MSMTDADLCKAVLGQPYGGQDFAHNIEACMELARAACKKWDLGYWVGRIPYKWKRTGTRARFSTLSCEKHWSAEAGIDEEAAALRAAVVKVAEAQEESVQ